MKHLFIKTTSLLFCGALVITGCNNSQQEQKLQAANVQDSLLLVKTASSDSSIQSYVHAMAAIEDNLDSIKQKEKILTMRSPEGSNTSARIMADIKAMDNLILKNNREIAALQAKIKKMNKKDGDLERMAAFLNAEICDRDSSIASLQNQLSQSNTSMKGLIDQFNDSMTSLNLLKEQNGAMKYAMHSVYYAVGTMKALKANGVIDKKGGVIGIGRTAELKQGFNSTYFTSADMTTLSYIVLKGKFSNIVTDQPKDAYKVIGTKSDSLMIADPNSFWSESKYLVVIIK